MDTNKRFADFINARFIAWEASLGTRATVTDFAAEIGVWQGDVSHWLKGRRIPGIAKLKSLAENPLIGPGVYEAAGYGYLVKDPGLIRALIALESLPLPMQEYFAAQIESARDGEQQPEMKFQTA